VAVEAMYEVTVRKLRENVKLKDPVCVHALPDVTEVGVTAVKRLVEALGAEKIVEVEFTDMPPIVIVENGIVRPPQVHFYAWRNPGREEDLLLIIGDDQPMTAPGIYALSEQIAKLISELNVKFLVALGGYLSDSDSGERSVYFTSTGELGEFSNMGKLERMPRGEIMGANGLVPTIAKGKYGINGVILLSETDGKLAAIGQSDEEAVAALLRTLKKYLKLPIDEEKMKVTEKKTRTAEMCEEKIEYQTYIY